MESARRIVGMGGGGGNFPNLPKAMNITKQLTRD